MKLTATFSSSIRMPTFSTTKHYNFQVNVQFGNKSCSSSRTVRNFNFGRHLVLRKCKNIHPSSLPCYSLPANSQVSEDTILKSVSKNAEVIVLSISALRTIQEAQLRHQASPVAAAALGRTLIGTLLLGALKQDAESVQVQFLGDGPLGQITAISTSECYVKGFVGNPLCDLPTSTNQMVQTQILHFLFAANYCYMHIMLSVGAAVGSGVMNVVIGNSNWVQSFRGSVPIYSGEIAEDFTYYLAQSEQINSAVGIGITFNRDGTVESAHGFLVQVLPVCSQQTTLRLEENIRNMPSLSDLSLKWNTHTIAHHVLKDIGINDASVVGSPSYGPCERKQLEQHMLRALASLGPTEIEKLLQEQGKIEIRCEFCADVLCFGEEDVKELVT